MISAFLMEIEKFRPHHVKERSILVQEQLLDEVYLLSMFVKKDKIKSCRDKFFMVLWVLCTYTECLLFAHTYMLAI